jgi:histidinol-phosphate aminotransferase
LSYQGLAFAENRDEEGYLGRLNVADNIESLEPYSPGKPIEELKREKGLPKVIKLASNENSFGPSPRAVEAIKAILKDLNRYPDGSGYRLKKKISTHLGQPPERIVLGTGTNEIIDLACRVFVGPGQSAVVPNPSFSLYQKFLQAVGADTVLVPLRGMTLDLTRLDQAVDDEVRLILIGHPNNPTGLATKKADLKIFLSRLPEGAILLIDEAYIEFVRDVEVGSCIDLLTENRNLIITRTFSKAYGLAGLRIGYGVMPVRLADYLNRVRQPFNITSPALAAAEAALDDHEYLEKIRLRTWAGLDFLSQGIQSMGLETFPSQTNFILFRSPVPADIVYQRMLDHGVIIRSMTSFGLEEYLRVNVGTEEENRQFLETLARVLTELTG